MSGVRKDRQMQRKAARKAALASLTAMTDDDLKNLKHELGRVISQQSQIVNEFRMRKDAVDREMERRHTETSFGINISDHAVLRYLERHKGVDIRLVREEIATIADRARKLGPGDQYSRRKDDQTGMVLGVNESDSIVTTLFHEREAAIFDIGRPNPTMPVKVSKESK